VDGVSEYRVLDSRYDEFLFAEIGEQDNGMPLSMASALTRLELDPWDEARRLAGLPAASAATAVAQVIGQTPGLATLAAEIPKLSARLVGLLAKNRQQAPVSKLARAKGVKGVTLERGKIAFAGRSWRLDGRWVVVAFAIGVVIIASRLILIG
jgi:hypothetical protein